MKDNLKILRNIFLLLIFLLMPVRLQAAPQLLMPAEENKASDAEMTMSQYAGTVYSLNAETMEQLWQGTTSSLVLPVNGHNVEFQQTERIVRENNLTWRGTDASGRGTVLLTLGKDHVYGQIFGEFGTISVAPDAAEKDAAGDEPSPMINVRLLDPAKETEIDDGGLVPSETTAQEEPGNNIVAAVEEDGSRIDVMVLYTNGMAAAHPGDAINTLIQNLIDLSNESFDNSGINTQFNLVHSAMVNYTDDSADGMTEALNDLTDNVGVFADVEALRTTYGADQVVLLRRYVDEGCGLAWIHTSSDPGYAYAVVHNGSKPDGSGYYCSDLTYAHEIGHNLGCHHDRANATGSGRYSYSYGYQSPFENFRTVMAYNCANGCPRIPNFSNPAIQYQGEATGVVDTAANSADNARTINQTRIDMANYRPAVISPYSLTVSKNGTGRGTVTSNPAGITCGTDCSEAYTSGQSVTLTASATSGSTFAGWGGACSGTDSCTVSMTADKSVTATFNSTTPSGTGSALPAIYKLLLKQQADEYSWSTIK